ncbi:MAG: aminopeptidase [Deltaproteobacteria bacterium]|nr:aminopeptidase [Deltaproteobacteria bacterium]
MLASIFLLNGCGMAYVVKQGLVHLSHIHRAKPIDKILKDPKKYRLSPEEIRKLGLVQEVQKYAVEKIGLKPSDNYTSYVKLPKDPRVLVYVVSASEKTKLSTYYWHFLIVGKVPYKGFFELEDAQTEAHYLKKEGYDVYVRGSSAFSTLGWFDDPLYSTMLKLDDLDLMDMLFHEMAHDTIYIKDNAELNESLATFVGAYATLDYIEEKFGKNSNLYKKQLSRISDSKLFSKFISKTIEKLEALYSMEKGKKNIDPSVAGASRNDETVIQREATPTEESILKEREVIFESAKKELQKAHFKSKDYSYFTDLALNNAVILAMNTYYANFEKFEKEFQKQGHKFAIFLKSYQPVSSK